MRQTRNVSLPPELDRFVSNLMHTGRYHSASEVVREALRLLEARERGRDVVSFGNREGAQGKMRHGKG